MVWGLVERGWLEAVTAVDDFAVVFAGGCGEGSGFSSRRNVIFFEDDAGETYGCSVTVMFDMLFTYSRCCVLHCTTPLRCSVLCLLSTHCTLTAASNDTHRTSGNTSPLYKIQPSALKRFHRDSTDSTSFCRSFVFRLSIDLDLQKLFTPQWQREDSR